MSSSPNTVLGRSATALRPRTRGSAGVGRRKEMLAAYLFLAPGFYHGPKSISDLVDFLVARCLDQLGIDNTLAKRWGDTP